ncbi:MAG: metallophosphoesterase [Gemmataceae bacterium]|nr:metallophosphoesterase [Gemmataceae bacterium]
MTETHDAPTSRRCPSAPGRAIRLAALFLLLPPPAAPAQEKPPTYEQWQAACAKLVPNRTLRGREPDRKTLPLRSFALFDQALDGFHQEERKGPLGQEKAWVGRAPEAKAFFDATRTWYRGGIPFQPFAQRLVLPDDAVVVVMGDLHGDVHSLLKALAELNRRKILDGFKLRDGKHRLLFLGDFCDRGAYGVEVLYTLLRLKAATPRQVHLARGNHEDFNIMGRYGFLDEFRAKFGKDAGITKLMRAFDLLPVVIYAGTRGDVLQMNHGGMEPGYDPRGLLASAGEVRYELLGKLRQKAYHKAHPGWLGKDPRVLDAAEDHLRDFTPESPTSPRPLGFMWNDFTVFADEPALDVDRSLVFGAGPTRHLLAQASTDKVRVRGVVRAHQHSAAPNPLMRRLVAHDGLFRHWQDKDALADAGDSVEAIRKRLPPEADRAIPDGSAWTFNVTPDSVYGFGCGFDFTTVGLLKLAADFKKWRMSVLKLRGP